ncbi:unnamed protein product [Closterium sp. Yama58-4]|nr:unnamed protein product [Closterium sp. Yama58-4]
MRLPRGVVQAATAAGAAAAAVSRGASPAATRGPTAEPAAAAAAAPGRGKRGRGGARGRAGSAKCAYPSSDDLLWGDGPRVPGRAFRQGPGDNAIGWIRHHRLLLPSPPQSPNRAALLHLHPSQPSPFSLLPHSPTPVLSPFTQPPSLTRLWPLLLLCPVHFSAALFSISLCPPLCFCSFSLLSVCRSLLVALCCSLRFFICSSPRLLVVPTLESNG